MNPVLVVEADAEWPARFEAERVLLAACLLAPPSAHIEHIGSTAVPGLAAKPIIDVLVGVDELAGVTRWIEPLAAQGYQYVSEYEVALPERRFFRKGAPVVTHHLHVVRRGSAFFEEHLRFRDLLRAEPERAAAYGLLKRRLAALYVDNRAGYTEAKAPWIAHLLGAAPASSLRLRSFKLRPFDAHAWIVPDLDAAGCPFGGPGVTLRGPDAQAAFVYAEAMLDALSTRAGGAALRAMSVDLERSRVLATFEASGERPGVLRVDGAAALEALLEASPALARYLTERAVACLARRDSGA